MNNLIDVRMSYIRRYFAFLNLLLACLVSFSFFQPAQSALHQTEIDLSTILTILFFVFVAAYTIIIKKINSSINFFLGGVIIIIIANFGNVGVQDILLIWISIFPLLAFFLAGKKMGLVWSIIYLSVVISIFLLANAGFVHLPFSERLLINSSENLIFITLVSFLASATQTSSQEILTISLEKLKKFEFAIQNSTSHIIMTDINGKIFFANSAATQITGYSNSEIIGSTPRLWGSLMEPDFYKKLWKTIKEDKKPFYAELQNRRKNGEIYTAINRISPIINPHGALIGFIGSEEDISTRVGLQKELEARNDELDRMNKYMVGREIDMINLKNKIKELTEK